MGCLILNENNLNLTTMTDKTEETENAKFTLEKYKFGVDNEYYLIVLMKMYKIDLVNLNDKNKYSPVDFRIKNTDIYIELKTRRINSFDYNETFFDKLKCDIWNKKWTSTDIYICFYFENDKKIKFIKYNDVVFYGFKTKYREDWDTTNYLIPLTNCIDLLDFIADVLN